MATAHLYQEDFRDLLRRVAAQGGCDLVVTSPPYCDARTYDNDVAFTLDTYAELGDLIFAALKPGGHCLFNVDAPVRDWREGFGSERGFHPWKMMIDWGERVGFRVVDRLCFGRLGSPGAYTGRFRNDWEPLFWFQRPGAKGYFDKQAIAKDALYLTRKEQDNGTFLGDEIEQDASEQGVEAEGSGGRMVSSRKTDGTFLTREISGWAYNEGKTHRGTLWDYQFVGNGFTGAEDLEGAQHPARFPFVLADDIVRCFCPPDGLVCDPFTGGGTSMIAALHNGRSFIGGDKFENKDGVPWVRVAAGIAVRRYAHSDSILGMIGGLDDAHDVYVDGNPVE